MDKSTKSHINDVSLLKTTGIFSSEQLKMLQQQWIKTADEFVAAINTPEGQAGIKQLLALSDEAFEDIIKNIAAKFSAQYTANISTDIPARALGVILPDKTNLKDNNPES